MSQVSITGLHHIGLPVNDLARAVAFYTEVLGMTVTSYSHEDGVRGHFISSNVPPDVVYESPHGETDMANLAEHYESVRPDQTMSIHAARLKAGGFELVLFERPEPIEVDSLVENGILHQSFRVSREAFDELLRLKENGSGPIQFSTGPVLRWPHGWALYFWDSEGNYLELEVEEDLPATFGVAGE
jgi:catechol 2,3-dioxygenase-like lactoylglutathione lyase family enzyme